MKRSARAILIKEGKILLINISRKDSEGSYYTFPGGTINEGEKPEEAIVREIKEEAGFEIQVERRVYNVISDKGDEDIYFLCYLFTGEQPRLGSFDEQEMMSKSNIIFTPKWLDISDLSSSRLLPEEVKTAVLQDLKADFSKRRELRTNSEQELRSARESFKLDKIII